MPTLFDEINFHSTCYIHASPANFHQIKCILTVCDINFVYKTPKLYENAKGTTWNWQLLPAAHLMRFLMRSIFILYARSVHPWPIFIT